LLIHIPHAQPAPLADPEWVLDRNNQRDQCVGKKSHGVVSLITCL
jgi:hypothetical protein